MERPPKERKALHGLRAFVRGLMAVFASVGILVALVLELCTSLHAGLASGSHKLPQLRHSP